MVARGSVCALRAWQHSIQHISTPLHAAAAAPPRAFFTLTRHQPGIFHAAAHAFTHIPSLLAADRDFWYAMDRQQDDFLHRLEDSQAVVKELQVVESLVMSKHITAAVSEKLYPLVLGPSKRELFAMLKHGSDNRGNYTLLHGYVRFMKPSARSPPLASLAQHKLP